MGFISLILEFLKSNRRLSFAGFGTFYLQNIPAQIESDAKTISPPGIEVGFDDSDGTDTEDFAAFVASRKAISVQEAAAEILKQVNFWKAALQKEESLAIEGVGKFFLNDSTLVFRGERLQNTAPDFYGLEEINLAKIAKPSKSRKADYNLRTSAYWLLPLILIISVLFYLGIAKPELIFGARTHFETPKPTPVKVVKPSRPDSLQIQIKTDSSVTDSIINPAKATTSLKNKSTRWGK